MDSIGDKLRRLRKASRMTGIELGRKSGVGQSTISQIESSKSSPTIDTLRSILNVMGVSLHEFFDDESNALPPDLLRLLQSAKSLTPEQRESITRMIEAMKDQ